MRATDYVLFSIDVHTYMVIYMIETRIIIAIFNSHYPLRAELDKILEVLVLVLVLVLEKLRTCPALEYIDIQLVYIIISLRTKHMLCQYFTHI